MSTTLKWIAGVLAFAVSLGCEPPPQEIDLEEQEQGVSAPPAPKGAPLGSLGGPCGKDFISCKTGEALYKKFAGLSKSSFKLRSAQCGTDAVLTYTLQVPRLVNDHKGSKDHLAVGFILDSMGETRLMEFARNGTVVAQYQDSSAWIDESRGGLEVILTLADKRTWTRFVLPPKSKGCDSSGGGVIDNLDCHACKGQKIALGVVLTTYGALVAIGASKVAVLAGTAVGAAATGIASEYFSCESRCKAAQCNTDVERCADGCGAQDSNCFYRCVEDFKDCCKGAGVVRSGVTECLAKNLF